MLLQVWNQSGGLTYRHCHPHSHAGSMAKKKINCYQPYASLVCLDPEEDQRAVRINFPFVWTLTAFLSFRSTCSLSLCCQIQEVFPHLFCFFIEYFEVGYCSFL